MDKDLLAIILDIQRENNRAHEEIQRRLWALHGKTAAIGAIAGLLSSVGVALLMLIAR
jgi:hypothetical protein